MSLFRCLSDLDLRKLQCVQYSLVRIATNITKYSHIAPVRKILHWLPIERPSVFKNAYKVVVLNMLNLFLNLDTLCTILAEVKPMVCCLRSHTLSHQFSGAAFTNIPNLSPILVIKFMTFVLVKIGPNLVFTKHVLARTIFQILC